MRQTVAYRCAARGRSPVASAHAANASLGAASPGSVEYTRSNCVAAFTGSPSVSAARPRYHATGHVRSPSAVRAATPSSRRRADPVSPARRCERARRRRTSGLDVGACFSSSASRAGSDEVTVARNAAAGSSGSILGSGSAAATAAGAGAAAFSEPSAGSMPKDARSVVNSADGPGRGVPSAASISRSTPVSWSRISSAEGNRSAARGAVARSRNRWYDSLFASTGSSAAVGSDVWCLCR